MTIDSISQADVKYSFTVQRISELHKLLNCIDKKTVNLFINEIRHTVSSYHLSQQAASNNDVIKEYERFFMRLDDKAHQLARFNTELSSLVKQAPSQLYEEAKKADRAIDAIHGKLVDLCITIDKLSKQKQKLYHDINITVQDIYYAYHKIFNSLPNCKIFDEGEIIPKDAKVDDLLIPVLEKLLLKKPQRCFKLVQAVPK